MLTAAMMVTIFLAATLMRIVYTVALIGFLARSQASRRR